MSEAALLEEAARADLEQAAGRSGATGVTFAGMTTIGCGGPAGFVIESVSAPSLSAILAVVTAHELPWFVLGLGSNLLVADEGWTGVVIRLTGDMKLCRKREGAGYLLDCGGGASLPRAASAAAEEGLSGLEPLAGIPGTIGGAVAMNAGAFGSTIGDFVREVEICQPGETSVLEQGSLDFGYRGGNLPPGAVVSRATLALAPGEPDAIATAMRDFRARREASQPLGKKTCGSVFRNPPGEKSAGELLDLAGCKGMVSGAAAVSDRHANFIVNGGGASSADILDLMNRCRRRVHDRFGVVLEPEVKLLGDIHLEPLS